ncbi:MAG: zinc ribbon domain-containing protein [Armatimonadota bacterium]
MTCQRCGAQIPEGVAACPNCRAPLAAATQPAAPVPVPQAPPPPAPQPGGRRKPVLLVIIIALFFVGAFTELISAGSGDPYFLFGKAIKPPAGLLAHLLDAAAAVAAAIGLLLMSRWGWSLGIVLALFYALSCLAGAANPAPLMDLLMRDSEFAVPAELGAMMQGFMVVILVVIAALSLAITAYLIWQRELFGIGVQQPTLGP